MDLEKEIAVRQRAEAALRQSRDELEHRVQKRTAELTASNASFAFTRGRLRRTYRDGHESE